MYPLELWSFMQGFIKNFDSDYGKVALFQVPLDDGENAFMKVHLDRMHPYKWCVILVELEKFFECWARDPYSNDGASLILAGKDKWCADYKYHLAEEGFARGYDDPVPLPTVECPVEANNDDFYVSVINGITRNLWLASKGAKYIPVECAIKKGAENLHRKIGLDPNSIKKFSELLSGT